MQFPKYEIIKSTINKYVENEIKERTTDHNLWVMNHRETEPRNKYNFIKEIEDKLKKCKEYDYCIKTYRRYTDQELKLIVELFDFAAITWEDTGNYKNDEFTYTFITKDQEAKKLEKEIEDLQKQLNHKSALLKRNNSVKN